MGNILLLSCNNQLLFQMQCHMVLIKLWAVILDLQTLHLHSLEKFCPNIYIYWFIKISVV